MRQRPFLLPTPPHKIFRPLPHPVRAYGPGQRRSLITTAPRRPCPPPALHTVPPSSRPLSTFLRTCTTHSSQALIFLCIQQIHDACGREATFLSTHCAICLCFIHLTLSLSPSAAMVCQQPDVLRLILRWLTLSPGAGAGSPFGGLHVKQGKPFQPEGQIEAPNRMPQFCILHFRFPLPFG